MTLIDFLTYFAAGVLSPFVLYVFSASVAAGYFNAKLKYQLRFYQQIREGTHGKGSTENADA